MALQERHRTDRIPWLRAVVLGANDGILSTAALVLGVAATQAGTTALLVAGVAGLVAGAGSMAVGEYVSVSSQKDAEDATLVVERRELSEDPHGELIELANIYVERGLSADLAMQVARELTANDVLEAHARDELGITDLSRARPVQAALSSFFSFAIGACIPIITVVALPGSLREIVTVVVTLAGLAGLGAASALLGGASWPRASARVAAGGALAMGISLAIGRLLGVTVG